MKLILGGVAAATLTMAAGAQAQAPASGADRRLDRVERDVRALQSMVMQAQATGQPVVVRPEGPDPALTALQSRLEDLEQALQRVNGQVETLGHDLEQVRRADQAADAERRTQTQQLNERLARIEAQLATLLPTPESGAAQGEAPRNPATDATGRAQAGDAGVLGGRPPPPPPPPPSGPNEAFAAARDLLNAGQNGPAADAFQDFISRYPNNARTMEAYYWLGESFAAQRSYQNAIAAYASALRSRPTTTWAPGAMVRLAQALTQANQNAQACAALADFDQRYAARATAAVKTNADAARRRARCG